MRWLFVGVIALNMLYFGWHLASPEAAGEALQPGSAAQEFPATLELVEGANSPAAAAPPSRVVDGCPAVGPWASMDEAGVVAKSVSVGGAAAELRKVDMKGIAVYWVYLPPLSDRAQANRRLRELQARGMDSFVVAAGPDANAISLGSFAARDSALGVQARLKNAGYGVEVREQRRDVQQIWVVLQDPAAQGYMEHMPADLRDRARQQRLPCDER